MYVYMFAHTINGHYNKSKQQILTLAARTVDMFLLSDPQPGVHTYFTRPTINS
jgi:hypothetical protein